MSHLSKIKTKIIDTNILLKTLNDLEIPHTQKNIANHQMPCIKIDNNLLSKKSSYAEFIWNEDTYELHADSAVWQDKRLIEFWNEKIHQQYAYNMILNEGFKQGFTEISSESKHTHKNDGSVRLVLEKWS
uniref:Uncharacterized protein ycf35 n=1 Tax=Helminthocladia australis TaxID=260093 RepID=A0A1G4NT85_9FLOR|nr:Hypothetical protein ycf35 [Helminthocladia australis]SCW21868.1 Hypothetical protein ycf35 [Helminthocladia australis]